MQDIRTVLSKLLGRGKPESKTLNFGVTEVNPRVAIDTAKPYRIMLRGADGNFVSKPATAEEAVKYANRDSAWRRLG